jgi:hypothetical protein
MTRICESIVRASFPPISPIATRNGHESLLKRRTKSAGPWMSLICIQECRVYTTLYSWLWPRPREGENVKKSSEQFSGGFSYVCKGLLFQKANLSFQPPRINDTQLRQVRSCHAAITMPIGIRSGCSRADVVSGATRHASGSNPS